MLSTVPGCGKARAEANETMWVGMGQGVQSKVMLNCNVKVTTVMQLLTGFTLKS